MAIQYYSTAQGNYQLDKSTGVATKISAIPTGAATITWNGSGLPTELQAGLSTSPVSTTPAYTPPVQSTTTSTSTPITPAPVQNYVVPSYDPSSLSSISSAISSLSQNAKTSTDYNTLSQLQSQYNAEASRQSAITTKAQTLVNGGSGSVAINDYYTSLAPRDQSLVQNIFGGSIIPGYTTPTGNVQSSTVSGSGISAPVTTASTAPSFARNLQPGDTGSDVSALQQYLVSQGYLTAAQVATGPGIYGPQTTAAVAAWQAANGVETAGNAGYFGPKSQALLTSLTAAGATGVQAGALTNGTTSPTTGSTGLPNNLGSTLGVNGAILGSVGANNLTNTTTLGAILPALAANSAAATLPVSSTIAGIIALINQPGTEDAQIQQLNNQISTLQANMGNEGTDFQNALTAAGVPQYRAQLSDLNASIAQLQGQIGSFDTETQQGLANITGQAIPQDLLYGQASAYQTQRDAVRSGLASQLAADASLQQAYSNNLTTAENLAQTSVTLKWQGISNQLDLLTKQLTIYQSVASSQDAKNTNIVNVLLAQQQAQVTALQKTASDIASLTVQAASGGAPLSVINQMRAAPDATTAALYGAKYLKGPTESTATPSTASTTEIKSGTLNYTKAMYSEDSQKLNASRGSDNYVDPNVYLSLYNAWIANGGVVNDFLTEFPPKLYVNPANTWLPSYLMPPKANAFGDY